MKIATATKYGSPGVLRIENAPTPAIKDDQILVKNYAVAVTAADVRIRGARFPKGFGILARLAFGLTKPRNNVLGSTFSGVIEAVGANVSDIKVGDEVCGLTGIKMGTYAEYVAVDARKSVVKKPSAISHTDAAGMLFGGTAALYFLRDKANLQKGETVCVNGASGAVGTNAVQLAKYFGARVTAVTTGNHEKLVKELGASNVVDYTKTNIQDYGKKYDVVLDAAGNITPADAKILLSERGRLLLMVASLGQMIQSRGNVKTGTATEKAEDIRYLLELMAQGHLKTVVDKVFTFDDIVAAHTYVESGHKAGNVVLTFN